MIRKNSSLVKSCLFGLLITGAITNTYSDEGRPIKQVDIYIDGPDLTIHDLWDQICFRSPYKVFIEAEDKQKGTIPVNGVSNLADLVNKTVQYYKNNYGIVLTPIVEGYNIKFLNHSQSKKLEVEVLESRKVVHMATDVEKQEASKNRKSYKYPEPKFIFPINTNAGLQGLTYGASLIGFKGGTEGLLNFDLRTTYSKTDFDEISPLYKNYDSGYYLKNEIGLGYWFDELTQIRASINGGKVISDVNLIQRSSGRSYFLNDDTGYDFGDGEISVRRVFKSKNIFMIPEVGAKVPINSHSNNMNSSNGLDRFVGLETLSQFKKLEIGLKANYIWNGEIDVFGPTVKSIDPEDCFGFNVGAGIPINIGYIGTSFNFQQNPLRGTSDLKVFEKEMMNVGVLYFHEFEGIGNINLESAFGLTESSPQYSISISFGGLLK